MNFIGRKKIVDIGGKILALTFLSFGLSQFIDNYWVFLFLGGIARTL
jgi:hypothetical protein